MKRLIKNAPLYLVFLSIFFVFHGYTENYNYIPAPDAAMLLAVYLGASLLLAGLFWLFYKNTSKAALPAFVCMFFFFFFGSIYDSVNSWRPNSFLGKYTVLLGSFLIVLMAAIIFLTRWKKSLQKFNYVLNVFFVFLLLAEVMTLLFKVATFEPAYNSSQTRKIITCDTCSKPDVYLIVTDAYAGDQQLRETMNYNNADFYSALNARGFHTPASNSNYNYTPFSCASMLQMEYLQGLEKSNTSHRDLLKCNEILNQNEVTGILQQHGYEFFNYSIFDMWGRPSIVKETVLPSKTKFITAQTLFSRLYTNAIFNMANRFAFLRDTRLYYTLKSNERALDSTRTVVSRKTGKPKFIYSHLLMPHYPYYFDEQGNQRKAEEIYDGKELDIEKYLSYMKYTNKVLLALVDDILKKSSQPPIIIMIADHGFREYPFHVEEKYQFNNFFAIHLPSKNYSGFYDGISNVNVFRTLFNQQFNQQFPQLKDSTIWINP